MIKIENAEIMGWEHAVRGMRNPLNSWEKSDSEFEVLGKEPDDAIMVDWPGDAASWIGPNDQKLMMTLRNAGTDHRKFMRMLTVYVDITAPLYWWKEFDTYKVGTVANSCSTMHKIQAKEFTLDDFSCEHLDTDLEDEKGFIPWDDLYKVDDGEAVATYMSNKNLMSLTIEMLNFYRHKYNETKNKKYWWQMIQLLPSSYNQKRTVMLNYEVLANMYKSRRDHKLDEWHTFCDWIKDLPYSELITNER